LPSDQSQMTSSSNNENCFQNLPDVWDENTPFTAASQNTNIISNPMTTSSCMVSNNNTPTQQGMTTMSPPNQQGMTTMSPPQMMFHPNGELTNSMRDLRQSSLESNTSINASMPLLPSSNNNYQQQNGFLPQQQNFSPEMPSGPTNFSPSGPTTHEQNELMQQLQGMHHQHTPQYGTHHQFPTPPSIHSTGAYLPSPNTELSPSDMSCMNRNVFLTPSPDTPHQSPGRWSTSPPHSSNSESSVC